MAARIRTAAVLAAGAVLAAAAPASAAAPDARDYPSSMAALGDSITRGFNACGWYFDCTARSWSTGDSDEVDGLYHRLTALNPAIEGERHNNAETGATSADLAAQAADAVDQDVAFVTVLIGANDACADTPAQMTAVDEFRANIDAAFAVLAEGLPDADVFVASIPDIHRLWEIGKDDPDARDTWSFAGICQSMLAAPLSTDPAAVQRRDGVRQRVVDYNTALAGACAAYGEHCRFDGNAVFTTAFTAAEVSDWDHFHPNAAGQHLLAEVAFTAAFGPPAQDTPDDPAGDTSARSSW